VLNQVAVAVSLAILVLSLVSLMIQAFAASFEAGIRCLTAIVLPPIVITYTVFFTPLLKPPDRIPEVNLYFIFTIWSSILFILVNYYFGERIFLGVLGLSLTLTGLVYIYKYTPFQSLLSCSYGIISGFLICILLFGLPGW
jgi:hypothetical protein